MPIFPPRDHPIKKKEELAKREFELVQAIRKGLPLEKLGKAAEKFRKAHISLLKAKIHTVMEETYKKRSDRYQPGELEINIESWERKFHSCIWNFYYLRSKLHITWLAKSCIDYSKMRTSVSFIRWKDGSKDDLAGSANLRAGWQLKGKGDNFSTYCWGPGRFCPL